MDWIDIESFTAWAQEKCLVLHPNPVNLAWIEIPGGKSRYWLAPPNGCILARLFEDLFDGLDPWASCILWPTRGGWPSLADAVDPNVRVYNTLVRLAGIN